jgi:hypothetical protein
VNFSLKTKFPLAAPLWRMLRLFTFLGLIWFGFPAFSQNKRPATNTPVVPKPTEILPTDTAALNAERRALKADSIRKRQSDIETTITYSARDSIRSSVDRKIVHLYGDAKIQYGIIQLMAEDITIDYETSTISADGKPDSTGKDRGYPIFINGSEKYETKSIIYNFKTKKARISEVLTKQGEGILHGSAVYKNERNELLSIRNAYTTCDLKEPHYEIIATRAKAIPGDKMVVGPFHMAVNSVPLPVGFLFGIFPSPRKSASGIIVPAYGEERNRGFFLRNGGYFFDINDYIKMQITGDLYSRGSSAIYLNSNYRMRYKYTGAFNFSFTSNRTSTNVEVPNTVKDFRITWNHTPQTKGTGRFSASVNAATASFNNSNFLGVNTNPSVARLDNTTRKLSSNISYSKTFGSKVSMGINYRINQDLTTKEVDMPLPDLSFNVNNIYPFKKVSKGMLLQNLSTRLTMTATNQITNNLGRNFYDKNGKQITHDSIAKFDFQNLPLLIRNARKGVRYVLPLSTSFKVLKFFTVSPSINYNEVWYFEKLNWAKTNDSTVAVRDTVRGFNRLSTYQTSVNLTTRIYGTYFFKKTSRVQAIRHIINPSIGYSYQPDFSDPAFGYFQEFNLKNNKYPVFKSVHENFVYGSATTGSSSGISFGINNNIEMKVKSRKDTVARKVALFNTLSISSSYNFKADSFKLAPFNLAANTNVLNDKLNVNMTATLDPYKYVTVQSNAVAEKDVVTKEIRTAEYAWGGYTVSNSNWQVMEVKNNIGRITAANIALSTNLNPKGQKKDTDTRDKISKSNATDADKKYLLQNPDSYIDFNIPWNLRIAYNADYQHQVNTGPRITQTVRLNGDLGLSEHWKIVFNTGYDFQQHEITYTTVTLSRDLHCWQMNLSWVPFGKFQSYNFTINVKSNMLRDLKLNRTRSFFDN